ncbi:nuclear transport factor 2 family protein [Mycobacterium sp.]|uniref:nuclear transport factor 2 family protein n=1 Tax=Mycobacterium sp. TaxID=1785 RepID=UPI003BAB4B23
MTADPKAVVAALWETVCARNWNLVKQHLSVDCVYLDMPTGPTLAARGPDDIVKRLKVALEPLAGYTGFPGVMLSDKDDVMYEHSERWTWESGETALLNFVSVHKVIDGKIALWKDYWDFAAIANHAPPTWIESMSSADMSWIYDATGKVSPFLVGEHE